VNLAARRTSIRLPRGRAEALENELADLFRSQNSTGREDASSIPATFVRVTITA
jgi:hypothetical protein